MRPFGPPVTVDSRQRRSRRAWQAVEMGDSDHLTPVRIGQRSA